MPLHRTHNRMVAGVCGGVAQWLGWSPTTVRILWAILTPTTFFGGFILYLVLWVLMPNAPA